MQTNPNAELERNAKILEIVVQAFGAQGKMLSDNQAAELLPAWIAAFRGIPTHELENTRADGLERGCKTAPEFVTVFLSGVQTRALEAAHRQQKQRFRTEKENAVQPGAMTPAKANAINSFRQRGWIQ